MAQSYRTPRGLWRNPGATPAADSVRPGMTGTAPAPTTATAHGQRFVLTDTGTGPLVVLLHGFPDTPAGWAPAATTLNRSGYRTVVPYLRGYHPDTIVPDRGYSGDEIAADAVRLLDAVGADRAVLVGHDWGAAIAYRAAELA